MRHLDLYHGSPACFRVGLCQVETRPWDIEGNTSRLLTAMDEAAAQGAEVIITPECVLHGYAFEDAETTLRRTAELAETAEGPNVSAVRERARQRSVHVILGFAERGENGRTHNTAALIMPDGSVAWFYRKVHCRPFELAGKGGAFTPGDAFHVSELAFARTKARVGAFICFDREVPEAARCLRAQGAEFIACPLATNTARMDAAPDHAHNELLTQARAADNEVFIAVVNHAGRFNGGSFVVGPYGEPWAQLGEGPEVRTLELPVSVVRQRLHAEPLGWRGWGNRRPEVYGRYLDRHHTKEDR